LPSSRKISLEGGGALASLGDEATIGELLFDGAVVLNLFYSRTPRGNFTSTLYPQSSW
jgi:hypothetical protein